jgi:GNAT superfamily N-acetyltransferase
MPNVDPWRPYVEFRRDALRALAATSGLTYFRAPGIFGALHPSGGEGGGIWAMQPDVAAPLTRALERGTPDWVALTAPAAGLLPIVSERGCTVARSVLAMGLASLSKLPELPLPPDVSLQRIDADAGEDAISVEEALLVDVLHGGTDAASARRDLPLEADALRSLQGITLVAAVDAGGSCVATAGTRVVGRAALVSAVATIPQYRRRGIAAALTASALRAARDAGATRAFLDASDGESVYARLGFTSIGMVTRCERAAETD